MIPLIIGATVTISKSPRKYLSNVQGKHEIKELQTMPYWALHTHTYTHTHTVESANVKVQNISQGRNNITCSTDRKYRTAATPYTLET